MSDPDHTVILPAVNHDDLPERLWAYDSPPPPAPAISTRSLPPARSAIHQPRLPPAALRRRPPGSPLGLVGFVIGWPVREVPTRLPGFHPDTSPTIRTRTLWRYADNVTLAESPSGAAHRNLVSSRRLQSSRGLSASVTTNQVLLIRSAAVS